MTTTPGARTDPPPGRHDMGRFAGDAGMPILSDLGAAFGVARDGRSSGTWTPSRMACNPGGAVQGGVYAVVLDAAMSLALHSAVPKGDTAVSLELKVSQLKAAGVGSTLEVRGAVIRQGGSVIFATAEAIDGENEAVAQATGTFLRRKLPRRTDGRWSP